MKRRASEVQDYSMNQRSSNEIKINGNPSVTLDQQGTSEQIRNNCNTTKNPIIKQLKREVMKLYEEKNYNSALAQCTLLIEKCPNDALSYGSRAACHLKLEHYVEALEDAKQSVELDPEFINGHCRVIKCALILHKLPDMYSSVYKLKEIDSSNTILGYHAQKMRHLFVHYQYEVNASAVKNYVKALEHIEKALTICPHSVVHKMRKAECLINLQRFSEAEELAYEILVRNPNSSESHFVLGRCYFESDVKKSVHHFEEAFRLDPECDKDRELYERGKDFLKKKTEAKNAYKTQDFSRAHDLYRRLLQEGNLNKLMMIPLHFHMAQASYELGDIKNCLMECGRVLDINSDHPEALLLRARVYLHQKKYEEAAKDLESAQGLKPLDEALRIVCEKLSKARGH